MTGPGPVPSQHIALLGAERAAGKTTQALAWVSHGEPTHGYPGWTRVLVLPHPTTYDLHRRAYRHRLEDFDHRVYRLDDWIRARAVDPETEVCVDDLDAALRWASPLGHMPGRLVAATMTTAAWDPVEFQESRTHPTQEATR